MKIAMLTGFYPPTIGGMETHVYELSRALKTLGHEVHVFSRYTPGKAPQSRLENDDGVTIHWLPPFNRGKLHTTPTVVTSPLKWWPVLRAWSSALAQLLFKHKFDIIHAHGVIPLATIANIASIRPTTKYVVTAHESQYIQGLRRLWYRIAAKLSLSRCKDIICVSREIEQLSRTHFPKKRVHYLSNAVDPEKFKPLDPDFIRKKYDLPHSTKIILCARRLDDPKNGVKYLLEAIPTIADALPNTRFIFVGSGETKSDLAKKLGKYADYAHYAGPQPNHTMPHWYSGADIAVLPSLYEATSIAGLEAMSCGTTLIGTNVGGIPEIIANPKLLCNPQDPEDLAKTIIATLQSDYKKTGTQARQRVLEKFTWIRVARSTMDIYKKGTTNTADTAEPTNLNSPMSTTEN